MPVMTHRNATATDLIGSGIANATGVNIDSELQKMLQIEKSYAANASVVRTAARMLDQLLAVV